MRKFGDLYKEKLNESESRQENRLLEEFGSVYNVMLGHYGLKSVHQLDEASQISFLTELDRYWNDLEGLTERGRQFMSNRSMELNERSTTEQKKNFLRAKTRAIVSETLRQSDVKYKLYEVLDQIYRQTKARDIRGILPTETIKSVLQESFGGALSSLIEEMNGELSESAKEAKK